MIITVKKEIPNLVEKLNAMPQSFKDSIASGTLKEIRLFITQPGGTEFLDRKYEEIQKKKKEAV